jgi:uncharacterized repeat protein (TIGR03803 family)
VTSRLQLFASVSPSNLRAPIVAVTLLLALIAVPSAQGQTFQVLHRFGGVDGAYPDAGLTIDAQGNLYGTTARGGPYGYGIVFRLKREGSGWVQNVLYSFRGGSDGAYPLSRVIFGPNGTLYGTTGGGGDYDLGVVFNLQPPPTACKTPLCPWIETVIHSFAGTSNGDDGSGPLGELAFDQAGNLYGTANQGGQYGYGMVYELTKTNGSWTESKLFQFINSFGYPYSGVTIDANGNLYGTVHYAYGYYGGVYELSPSGGGWTEQVIHYFQQSDGGDPYAGLILDAAGNLYGATSYYGAGMGGTAFELSRSNGGWSFLVLYSFIGSNYYDNGPHANLAFDPSGNLYGTSNANYPSHLGSVFELMPGGGGWSFAPAYIFNDPYVAANPISNVVFDGAGNLYGTTSIGGPPAECDCGTVWEITP